jgi:hypothetical protein
MFPYWVDFASFSLTSTFALLVGTISVMLGMFVTPRF